MSLRLSSYGLHAKAAAAAAAAAAYSPAPAAACGLLCRRFSGSYGDRRCADTPLWLIMGCSDCLSMPCLSCSCFLRAHLLQQLASRLQMQLLKQQALGFSALRSHAAVIAACKATAEATAEHAALRNRSFLETESPIRVSAATAAAASTRLQHLLDMSSALLDNQQQHSLLLETASCQKPLLYLPQPFPASHAAGAAGAAAASEAADLYAMRAHPSLLSQETCDDEEDFLLPSGGHQPTLLHRGARRGYCCIGAARNPADDAFDLETPFGFSGTSPLAASRTSEEHSAGPSPQHTQLVPPAVTLSHERSNISNNFLSSCKVLDCPDYAAQEGGGQPAAPRICFPTSI